MTKNVEDTGSASVSLCDCKSDTSNFGEDAPRLVTQRVKKQQQVVNERVAIETSRICNFFSPIRVTTNATSSKLKVLNTEVMWTVSVLTQKTSLLHR